VKAPDIGHNIGAGENGDSVDVPEENPSTIRLVLDEEDGDSAISSERKLVNTNTSAGGTGCKHGDSGDTTTTLSQQAIEVAGGVTVSVGDAADKRSPSKQAQSSDKLGYGAERMNADLDADNSTNKFFDPIQRKRGVNGGFAFTPSFIDYKNSDNCEMIVEASVSSAPSEVSQPTGTTSAEKQCITTTVDTRSAGIVRTRPSVPNSEKNESTESCEASDSGQCGENGPMHADIEATNLAVDRVSMAQAETMVEDGEVYNHISTKLLAESTKDDSRGAVTTVEVQSNGADGESDASQRACNTSSTYPWKLPTQIGRSSAEIRVAKLHARKKRRMANMKEKRRRRAVKLRSLASQSVGGVIDETIDIEPEVGDDCETDSDSSTRFDAAEELKRLAKEKKKATVDEWRQSPFAGLGYTTNPAKLQALTPVEQPSKKISGSQKRKALRLLSLVEGECMCMAIQPFARGEKLKSKLLTEELREKFVDYLAVESAIDSGATITIAEMSTHLTNFCESKSINIRAFNNAVTRSGGSGTMLGIMHDADGRQVVLEVPNTHKVDSAPSDLISAGTLVDLGYKFVLGNEGSYLVTPKMELVHLERRGGLFWLKWYKAVRKTTTRKSGVVGAGFSDVADVSFGVADQDGNRDAASSSNNCSNDDIEVSGDQDDGIHHASHIVAAANSDDEDDSILKFELDDELQAQELLSKSFFCSEQSEQCQFCSCVEDERSDDVEVFGLKCSLCGGCDGDTDIDSSTLCYCDGEIDSSCYCGSTVGETAKKKVPIELMHRRMGHFNAGYLRTMWSQKRLDVDLVGKHTSVHCDACKASKGTRHNPPPHREGTPTPTKPFEYVYSDVKGKLKSDFYGNRYMVIFTCEVTRWTAVYFCRKKSQVVDRFEDFLKWVKLQGYRVSLLTTDGGGEYTGGENSTNPSKFEKVCEKENIQQRFSAPNTQAQNGISERLMRTLIESAASMLAEAMLDHRWWSLAVKHAVWIRNRISHQALKSGKVYQTPFEKLYHRSAKLGMVRVFGCDSWRFDFDRKKADITMPKAIKGIFVGVSPTRKGWMIFDPKTRTIRTSYHCSFNEDFSHRRESLTGFKLRVEKAKLTAARSAELMEVAELYSEDPAQFLLPSDPDFGSGAGPKITADKPQVSESNTSQESPSLSDRSADSEAVRDNGGDQEENEGDEEVDSEEGDSCSEEEDTPLRRSARSKTSSASVGKKESEVPNLDIDELDDNGKLVLVRDVIPVRRAAFSKVEVLTVDHMKFLKFAFEHDWGITVHQTNPKSGKSRLRYELYKSAETLRQFMRQGGSWKDIENDYARGFIEFDTKSTATVKALKDLRRSAQQEASAGFAASIARVSGATSYDDLIRREFGTIGVDYLEGLSHSSQEVIKSVIGPQSLTEFACCCAARILLPEPITVSEAMQSEYAKEWRAAMDEEMNTLIKFNCFERVTRAEALSHGRLVKSKWVFKVKYNADGSMQRFKARIVGKGFTQVPGQDFYETYSPVFSYTSLRIVLARAAAKDLQIDQWDLKSSFIQQDIDVDHLYLEVPEGFDRFMDDGVTPAALHLKKSLYGLVQSSRLLHKRMSKFLKSKGFRQLVSDQCVFVKGTGADEVIVCTWVDDIIMASSRSNEQARLRFDMDIRSEFTVSPWTSGEAGWLLNMKVVRDWDKGTLHVSQEAAIEKLAQRFKLDGSTSARPYVPMASGTKLRKPLAEDVVKKEVFDYMSAVGGLLYIALTTRPDVAYSVGVLSRFMACPDNEHVSAAKRVIQYLYRTKEFGIKYSRRPFSESSNAPHSCDAPVVFAKFDPGKGVTADRDHDVVVEEDEDSAKVNDMVITYVDADLAGDADTMRSTTGFAIMLSGGIVSWLSKLQPTVALSTTEAETNAATELVKQISHVRLFLRELNCMQSHPTIVYEDNMGTIANVDGTESSKKTKHYLMKVHYLREQTEAGTFIMRNVATVNQLADIFTKPLPDETFCKFRDWMGVFPLS
jgi:hypothetical protein